MRLRIIALTVAAALAGPGYSLAWDGAGHEIVAAIAEDRLSPDARAMVREIIGTLPLSDPEIATWADHHRSRDTGPWHYVNIPFSAGHYVPDRDCPRGACAVAEIERAAMELAHGRDPERLTSLRWLVHVVADLHQPLHAGDGWDRGGNDLRVRLGSRKEPTNLHRVWDSEVLKPLLRNGRGPIGAIEGRIRAQDAASWAANLDPASWADESNREAREICAELDVRPTERRIVHLPRDYARREQPRAEARLARAGVRLAAMLNMIAHSRAAASASR